MTSITACTPPTPTRLADRRRFRDSIGGLLDAAVITGGSAGAMVPAAGPATIDAGHASA